LSKLPSLDLSQYRELLRAFLAEDLSHGDVTTNSIVPAEQLARGELLAKAPLVLAGVDLFVEVFRLLDPAAKAAIRSHDGDELRPSDVPLKLHAHARALLTGERVALNLLQRLSGVATLTRKYVRAIEGTSASIVDTRKTTPGLRALEKYAVRVGGGVNHRKDLAEAVLIKDNHIRLAGSVDKALAAVQSARGQVAWIEVEVTDSEQLHAALAARPDTILLDNMHPSQVKTAVEEIRHADPQRKIRIEASGGITLSNVRQYAEAGVDWISIGALTHSAPAVDLSFEIEPA
jgi:nicotinate-nucleotide pyrophosphorylase (carboxylating)